MSQDNSLGDETKLLTAQTNTTMIPPVKVDQQLFPYAIVWAPLPLITQLCPFIGHMGIADSRGVIHDFHGPYYVGINNFMVGKVYKYYQIPLDKKLIGDDFGSLEFASKWDSAITNSDHKYGASVHNIVTNNCHHHSAEALTNAGIPSSMIKIWWLITTRGKWVSTTHFIATYIPTLIIIGLILMIVLLVKYL